MDISVVVCTRDRTGLLAACLPSLLACSPRPREIIVVDQSRDDRTRQLVAGLGGSDDGLIHLATTTHGASVARNLGLAQVSGPLVAFTDDDCLVEPDWLSALAAEFRAEPRAAAVCGRVLPRIERPLVAAAVAVRTEPRRRVFCTPISPWRIGSGNNLAARVSALRAIGGFDEHLGPGTRFGAAEDADLLYRLLRRGERIVYSPRPLVYHRQWRDARQQIRLASRYGVGIGAFVSKHVRGGDLRPLQTLGGWVVSGLVDLAGSLAAGDNARAGAAARLLSGVLIGTTAMALHDPRRATR